ncbi:4-diphosphocytidyl-2-C-methyl-D-erythritol kinase [Candidatus Koribacter versatilis Ellin345]|uniref:4-diphosphocytidyl-2-C-methyl-D-erythritol kinase n=1 Tax=Koribacter versatilis (strain Ellin345) TaxID=204669 RepID=Q1IHV9_KORVE|nr:4-(cytidine 5'-diphospho)-2-C-methyl-D-erythritol kinase [Candidatus Koribacter versatilis]ABF43541.1 4-diphosphocytidyl-2-C-methyl-D-erythritol kinase [Candidatus Koribacter versatilis Ellin345]
MSTFVRSYAKINLGLRIGPRRADGFHDLRTMYTTIALHELVSVEVEDGDGIEIRCDDPRVPCDSTNTCHKAAALVLEALGLRSKVLISIEKRLPVQGGLGAASGNAIATIFGLERMLGKELSAKERAEIAEKIGSDLNLFLYGGLTLGTGRGEEVWPLPDLPSLPLVIVTPEVGVSTPVAFKAWDSLTHPEGSVTINEFNHLVYEWLSASGVPALSGDRAETLLLDLVRTGISNDFERVVFPEIPVLREVKCALEREGALYASLSGSGSTLYGLFRSSAEASTAAERLNSSGLKATATQTLPREQYWREMFQ